MLAGLQGSGKTTLAGKLARWLKNQGHAPMLVAADLQRPNAVTQLQIVGERAGVPVFAPEPGSGVGDPIAVARASILEAQRSHYDIVVVDTAGRLGIDAELMAQAADIRDAVDPDEILFVVDAMIGQDAVNTALAFLDGVGFDGVVLTKLDGDARGGAALSVASVTGRQIMFASNGEKLEDFDVFHPDRMAGRILDMGDVLTLIEQAERAFDADQAEEMARKLSDGDGFTLEDFLGQMEAMRKMGSMSKLLGMLPGMGQFKDQIENIDEREIDRVAAMIKSMTPEERRNPRVLNGSRRSRIARGSGMAVSDVNGLVDRFGEAQKMMKQLSSGGGMPGMPGLAGMGGMPGMGRPGRGQGRQGGREVRAQGQGRPVGQSGKTRAGDRPGRRGTRTGRGTCRAPARRGRLRVAGRPAQAVAPRPPVRTAHVALHLRGVVLPEGEQRDLWVRDGRLWTEALPGAETVVRGGWLLPGLVDAHCHIGIGRGGVPLEEVGEARTLALVDRDAGVLTIRDAGSPLDYAELDDDEDVPRLVRAGRHLAPPGRYLRGYAVDCEAGELPGGGGRAGPPRQRLGQARGGLDRSVRGRLDPHVRRRHLRGRDHGRTCPGRPGGGPHLLHRGIARADRGRCGLGRARHRAHPGIDRCARGLRRGAGADDDQHRHVPGYRLGCPSQVPDLRDPHGAPACRVSPPSSATPTKPVCRSMSGPTRGAASSTAWPQPRCDCCTPPACHPMPCSPPVRGAPAPGWGCRGSPTAAPADLVAYDRDPGLTCGAAEPARIILRGRIVPTRTRAAG